ncbi:tetratricopeptide repeat protein [Neobacillus dielmonensis]|uniref:tetratricopeptide repeat protein n=1 Tax=Neobacillus dielmonensis TaxID=1347369 RepID=UPI0005AA9ADF|nr:tetratricopeptide repeat protein [Neobacillus dielmonensis]
MLNKLQSAIKIETRILKNMHYVREMGNMGSHSINGTVEDKDAVRALDCLADIINWYLERYGSPLDSSVNVENTDSKAEPAVEKEFQLGENAKQQGDFITALVHYSNAAEHGHTEAQYQLGIAFKEGYGVHSNLEEAYKWFEIASEGEHMNSLFEVGSFYYYRTDEKKDHKKAFEYLTKAAEKGHPEAQILLGKMYQNGEGTDVNILKTIYWFNEAAEKHNRAEAYLYLGVIYEEGKYIKQNEKTAFQMYWRATNLENVEAMFRLGIMCLEGRGTETNLDQALYMFEKAAELGHEEALAWYQKAAKLNHELSDDPERNQLFESIADSYKDFRRSDASSESEDDSIPTDIDHTADSNPASDIADVYRKAASEVNANTKYKNGQEILEDVLATFAVIIEEHLEGIDPFKINWKGNTNEFFNHDQEKFGLILIDCHLYFGIEIDYDPYTELEIFPTLEHAYTHLADKVLIKHGFDPKTLKPIRKKSGFFKSLFH